MACIYIIGLYVSLIPAPDLDEAQTTAENQSALNKIVNFAKRRARRLFYLSEEHRKIAVKLIAAINKIQLIENNRGLLSNTIKQISADLKMAKISLAKLAKQKGRLRFEAGRLAQTIIALERYLNSVLEQIPLGDDKILFSTPDRSILFHDVIIKSLTAYIEVDPTDQTAVSEHLEGVKTTFMTSASSLLPVIGAILLGQGRPFCIQPVSTTRQLLSTNQRY